MYDNKSNMNTSGQLRDLTCASTECPGNKTSIERRAVLKEDGTVFDGMAETAHQIMCTECGGPMKNIITRMNIGGTTKAGETTTAEGQVITSNGTLCQAGRETLGPSAIEQLGAGGSGDLQMGGMSFHAQVSSGGRNVEIVRTDI